MRGLAEAEQKAEEMNAHWEVQMAIYSPVGTENHGGKVMGTAARLH